jgi:hypothetical protein
MKKLVYLLIAVSLMLALFPAVASAHTEGDPYEVDLIAGGGNPKSAMDVGNVLVWNDGENLYVKYEIAEADWCITKTHLAVATAPGDIPQKNGNPIPGLFEYNDMHDCVTEYTYEIPLEGDGDTELYIAAHANVQKLIGWESDLAGLEAALPDTVTMKVTYPYSGGPAYFPHTYVSGGTILDGDYLGWCVDTDNVIYQNVNYTANVYSSYEPLPAGTVEKQENLDLVNWIINQGFKGQPSACGGNYTYGDVQRAIWALIEDGQSTSGLYGWSQCRVDEILAAAHTYGEGFEPGCGDVVAVILVPVNGQQIIIAQVTFIEVGVPCIPVYQTATAWGGDSENPLGFPGKNWATYFTYSVQ